MEYIRPLLPCRISLQLHDLQFNESARQLFLELQSTQEAPQCPRCQQPSQRIHSRYRRTLADLPWADWIVSCTLTARKFRCLNHSCCQQIFCERLSSVAAPWARRTTRLATRQRQIGLTSGGRPGERLSQKLGCPVSRHTLLRQVRHVAATPAVTPRVLGVDDFATRKGQRYGTILVDLERSEPVDLLPDRASETLAAWLRDHPGVEVICRDRMDAYAQGATAGAPQALQVADRWHLLCNLSATLQQVFEHYHTLLTEEIVIHPPPSVYDPRAGDANGQSIKITHAAAPLPSETPSVLSLAKRERRKQRYDTARRLHRQGWTISAIARELHLARKTVRHYIQCGTFPELKRQGKSKLDPYKAYIIERWNQGGCTGTQLYREILHRGYPGKRTTVLRYIQRLRQTQGLPPRALPPKGGAHVIDRPIGRLSPRQASRLVLRREEQLTDKDHKRIVQLREKHPKLEEAIALAQGFARIIRGLLSDEFDEWLLRAKHSSLKAFQRFAKSLRSDYDAVRGALTEPWSTSMVEGHINRLKTLKREMYGRAQLDLLKIRMLEAA